MEDSFFERISKEIQACSLKNRLESFLPVNIFQILENKNDVITMFIESEDVINEVISYIQIIEENYSPDPIRNLQLEIPVMILDFKELVLEQCP